AAHRREQEDARNLRESTCAPDKSQNSYYLQEEDGIRYASVTGVQTCALPISLNLRMSCSNRREKTRDVRSGEAPYICLWETGEAVPHLRLRKRSKLGFAHACACLEP